MAERDEPYFGTFPCLYCIDNRFIVFSRAATAAMLCVRVRRCVYAEKPAVVNRTEETT